MGNNGKSPNAYRERQDDDPEATIVLTTRDCRDLLRRAIEAARRQTVPVEIMVMDDNSANGTAEMMEREFPDISYHRTNRSKGLCFHRNSGIALAQTEIVFPLGDDSVLESPETVAQTLREFEDPLVGAVTIPSINLSRTDTVPGAAPDGHAQQAPFSAAHAVRRAAFFKAGGYRESSFHIGEGTDLCIRMRRLGLLVKRGAADPIRRYRPQVPASFVAEVSGCAGSGGAVVS